MDYLNRDPQLIIEGEDFPHIQHIQDFFKILNKTLKPPEFIFKTTFINNNDDDPFYQEDEIETEKDEKTFPTNDTLI